MGEKAVRVEVIIGSESDRKKIQPCLDILSKLGIPWALTIVSCHRHTDQLDRHITELIGGGVKFIIAAAGMAADLPGFLTAKVKGHGILVIGVALSSANFPDAMDALLNIVRMPPGVPLVCAGIDEAGAKNAALFVAEACAALKGQFGPNERELSLFYKKMQAEKPVSIRCERGGAELNTETLETWHAPRN
ncbi:MAG: AIR carboxylase family protein [Patescibacteria group bacterium]